MSHFRLCTSEAVEGLRIMSAMLALSMAIWPSTYALKQNHRAAELHLVREQPTGADMQPLCNTATVSPCSPVMQ
jgi:hypothetical protein